MKKRLAAVFAILVIAGTAGVVAVRALGAGGTVYSVSQLDEGLRRHPVAWVGRVVQVRGVVGFCPVRAGCPPNIPPVLSPRLGNPSPDPPLQLRYDTGGSLLSALRRTPLLGMLVAAPARLIDGYQGVVRVRIEPAPLYACYEALCFEGVLQDMRPP